MRVRNVSVRLPIDPPDVGRPMLAPPAVAPFTVDPPTPRPTACVHPIIAAALPDNDGNPGVLRRTVEAAPKTGRGRSERFGRYTRRINRRIASKRVAARLELESRLRQAIERREFVLHYQPKVDALNGRLAGVEALIRWQSPGASLVLPGEFIPQLEQTGLILEVGAWALGQAIADHRSLQRDGFAPRIAVNVSAALLQADFVARVRRAFEGGHGFPGIDFEISESLIMKRVLENIGKLEAFRELGLNIAIDHFGADPSSLGHLTRLPVQGIKIDRSFIESLLVDPKSEALVSAIVSIAHSVGLKVCAVGVETSEQADALRRLRCDQLQGYLIGRPVPLEELAGWLRQAT